MKKYYININQYKFLIDKFPEILKKFSGKTLILSLIQEDRSLEKKLKISDEIIYDNSDYINGTVGFTKAIMEIDENIEILPSSYKMKETSVDFNKILDEIDGEEYENLIVLFDDKMVIENMMKSSNEEIKKLFSGLDIEDFIHEEINREEIIEKEIMDENIEKIEEKQEINNMDNKKILVKKVSIFEKIKRLFRKNG